MASVDWTDCELDHRLAIEQVVPGDLSSSYPSRMAAVSATVTTGYYVDARSSASLRVRDLSGLVENAWIRIVHRIPSKGYSHAVGTYVVAGVSASSDGRYYDLDLRSPLWAMGQDRSENPYSIGNGARLSDVIGKQFGWALMQYRTDGMADYVWRSPLVLEAAETRLSWMFDTLDPTQNRLDVDTDGRCVVTRYTAPHDRSASLSVDAGGPRSVVVAGSVRWEGNRIGRANRVITHYSDGDVDVCGVASAPSDAVWARQRRGWTLVQVHDVKDVTGGATRNNLSKLAQTYLSEDMAEDATWELETLPLPIAAGSVVDFAPRDADPWGAGGFRKALVQSCDLDMAAWRMKLTLKEV